MIKLNLKSNEKMFVLALVGYALAWVFTFLTFWMLPGPARGLLAVIMLCCTLGIICWFVYLVIIFFIEWYRYANFHGEGRLGKFIAWLKRDDRM